MITEREPELGSPGESEFILLKTAYYLERCAIRALFHMPEQMELRERMRAIAAELRMVRESHLLKLTKLV